MTDTPQHPHQKVHAFLKHHPMGVLSTLSVDGSPWGSAIYYVSDENFNFYFVTRAETFKYKNIEKNSHVALTIADNESQTTVQVAGTISPIPVEDYMEIVFGKLTKVRPKDDNNWAPPLAKIRKGNYMPLCITPSKLQYADYKHIKSGPHSSYIENIIPA